MRLIAELTMPSNNSWDGSWSGEKDKYTKVFYKSDTVKNREYIGNYGYNFGDGWRANVEVREAKPSERVSNKFCGYDWMISSIKAHKEIRT